MLTSSFLKTAKTTKYFPQNSGKLSQRKKSKKYQTPGKSYASTNPTKNVTMSVYAFTSKKKATSFKDTPKLTNHSSNKSKGLSKGKRINNSCLTEQKGRKFTNKSIKIDTMKRQPEPSVSKILNNTSFYRSTRASLDSKSSIEFMSKISKIFDLVTLHSQLPQDTELFLRHPLHNLRASLKRNGKNEIAKILLQFKNDCSQIFRNASSSELCIFLRTHLPENTRWSSTRFESFTKKENQRYLREKYFESLKKKSAMQKSNEDQRLTNLENRLNEFWDKSLKARKVLI